MNKVIKEFIVVKKPKHDLWNWAAEPPYKSFKVGHPYVAAFKAGIYCVEDSKGRVKTYMELDFKKHFRKFTHG